MYIYIYIQRTFFSDWLRDVASIDNPPLVFSIRYIYIQYISIHWFLDVFTLSFPSYGQNEVEFTYIYIYIYVYIYIYIYICIYPIFLQYVYIYIYVYTLFFFSYGQNEEELGEGEKDSFENLAIRLGARGVTLVAASGDDGAIDRTARSSQVRTISHCLSKCAYTPLYPDSCPYLTSIDSIIIITIITIINITITIFFNIILIITNCLGWTVSM
jgi:hypothetical protein